MQAKSAILFVNGDYSDSRATISKIDPSDFLVAVDGGLNHLLRMGKFPDLLVGDLDSITNQQASSSQKANVEILRFPIEKDETDLELALLELASRKFTDLRILGGLGKRIDQTLGNISLLALPELQSIDVRLVDDACEIFLLKQSKKIKGKINDRISLLPLFGSVTGITTTGLDYPLKNETLYPEKSRGISNVMTRLTCTINFVKGRLLCIHYFHRTEKSRII
jgi:thiamine pyrophosphokinase